LGVIIGFSPSCVNNSSKDDSFVHIVLSVTKLIYLGIKSLAVSTFDISVPIIARKNLPNQSTEVASLKCIPLE